MRLEDTVISANYAALMVRLCEKRDIPMSKILEGTGIDPEIFTHSSAFLSGKQFVHLTQNAYNNYNDPALGIHYGLELSISTHGMVGFATMTSPNLREGLEIMMRYYRSIFSMVSLELVEEEGFTSFRFDIPYELGALRNVLLDGFLVGYATVFKFLLGEGVPQIKVHRDSAHFDYCNEANGVFDFTVEYNREYNEIVFETHLLDISFPSADPQTLMIAKEHCEQLLKQSELGDTFLFQVKKELYASKGRLPNLENLAKHFNMHPRTLGRRLSKDGTSYQDLLDEVRGELALDYLADPNMLIEDIAYALNFNDTSSFYRAFKRWTGDTPSAQRKKLIQQKASSITRLPLSGSYFAAS